LQEKDVVRLLGSLEWEVSENRDGSQAVIKPPREPSEGARTKEEEKGRGRKVWALKKLTSVSLDS
jgi:hypothetical protein